MFSATAKSGNDAATVGSVYLDGRLRSGLQWRFVASSATSCRHLSQNVSLAANVPIISLTSLSTCLFT